MRRAGRALTLLFAASAPFAPPRPTRSRPRRSAGRVLVGGLGVVDELALVVARGPLVGAARDDIVGADADLAPLPPACRSRGADREARDVPAQLLHGSTPVSTEVRRCDVPGGDVALEEVVRRTRQAQELREELAQHLHRGVHAAQDTVWLPRGIPASASFFARGARERRQLLGWLKCVLMKSGWYL